MAIGAWFSSILGSRDESAEEEQIKYRCSTCGSTFEQPAGADICPNCYETGITQIEGDE